MRRRSLIKAGIMSSAVPVIVHQASTSGRADTDVISEITLPQDGARGLGATVVDGSSAFAASFPDGEVYYVYLDGSSDGPLQYEDGTYPPTINGIGINSTHVYWSSNYDLRKAEFGSDKEPTERDMPQIIQSVATDEDNTVVWVGGEEGRIWEVDPDTLGIESSISVSGSVFALAYDGDYLWIGHTDSGQIQQYDTSTRTTVATYDYPNAQTIYDYGYLDNRLWLLGDGTLYQTSIDKSVPNDTPSASFSVSQNNPEAGDTVSFDASTSSDPDGRVQSYEWDFTEDGSVDETGETASYNYNTPGEYTVSLTVTDDDGATDSATQTVTVTEMNEPPEAQISISPSEPEVGQEVTFSAGGSSDPDGSISTYEWYLSGDGSVDETGETASYLYTNSGEYTVSLTVTDDEGVTDDITRTVTVTEMSEPPEARMSVSPSEPEVGQEVTFSAGGSSDPDGSISTYEWDLTGDGSVETTGQEVTYTYDSSGEFWVTLTVVDSDDLSSETRNQITVQAGGTDESDEEQTSGDGSDSNTTDESGPGFGIGSGLAGIGGSLYMLKRRLGDEQSSE
ncbi:PKD domain-containing protein [Halovenus halobia]|uniref:PKD domain-containing protein n=1 Tax=Halovenus halobia TaxID=3396622 RepID=UPI003F569E49